MIERTKYKNIIPQQNKFFFDNLEKLLCLISPDRIIEIGTGRGATTRYISEICKNILPNTKIKTFDIAQRHNFQSSDMLDNVQFYGDNIFNYHKGILLKPEEITDFLSQSGPNLILCDGGNKIQEFNILSYFIKKGDVIMAHDYAPNKEIFENEYKGIIWDFCEITDKDIQDCVEKNNLGPYNEDLIKKTAWVAKIKK